MQKLEQVVLDSVNLGSYSESPGFIGYFERADRYIDGMADVAVALFFDMPSVELDGWTLVSSLHANDDEVGSFGDAKLDARDLGLVEFLCKHDALHRFSYGTRFGRDYDSNFYASAVENALLELTTILVDVLGQDVLRQLLVARMLVYGLRGHCFLVSEQKGLILYPHDDTGFGVIAFGDTSCTKFALEFLNRGGSLQGFRSVVAR